MASSEYKQVSIVEQALWLVEGRHAILPPDSSQMATDKPMLATTTWTLNEIQKAAFSGGVTNLDGGLF